MMMAMMVSAWVGAQLLLLLDALMSGKRLSHNTSYNINISIIITSNITSPSVLLSTHPSIISKRIQKSLRPQIYHINIALGQKVDSKFVKTNHAKLSEGPSENTGRPGFNI